MESMSGKIAKLAILSSVAAVVAGSSIAYAQGLSSRVLSSLDSGMWDLRTKGSGSSRALSSKICVGPKQRLVQIQHGNTACSQRVVSEQGNRVTISYNCRGHGQGVTTIRKETNGLVQISSQGIRDGSPFNFKVEARHIGGC